MWILTNVIHWVALIGTQSAIFIFTAKILVQIFHHTLFYYCISFYLCLPVLFACQSICYTPETLIMLLSILKNKKNLLQLLIVFRRKSAYFSSTLQDPQYNFTKSSTTSNSMFYKTTLISCYSPCPVPTIGTRFFPLFQNHFTLSLFIKIKLILKGNFQSVRFSCSVVSDSL